MFLIQVLGAVLVVAGLILFVYDQVKDKEGDSTVSVWKLNVSGPPPLVLVVFGTLVFLFPFTPWWSDIEEPPPPSTIPIAASTTEPVAVTTTVPVTMATFGDTTTTFTTTTLADVVPLTPSGYDIYFDEDCGADVVEWYQDDPVNTAGWVAIVEKYDPVDDFLIETYEIDTLSDLTFFGNWPLLCYWDFIDHSWNKVSFGGDGYYYYIWVYAYNHVGYSDDALWIEYYDF
ncbi:MAG: hypothetical protein R3330_09950 [Saprospiraceae bacterium]|nr:hypothetical protein [Saprospiraceae bacterium]